MSDFELYFFGLSFLLKDDIEAIKFSPEVYSFLFSRLILIFDDPEDENMEADMRRCNRV